MLKIVLLFLLAFSLINADTPANCTYDDIVGNWIIREGPRGLTSNVDCTNPTSLTNLLRLQLLFPNVAVDQFGNEGTWTIIYNQGFEVNINSRRYFAFSNWTTASNGTIISLCHLTNPGWSHDVYVRDWSCFVGKKAEGGLAAKVNLRKLRPMPLSLKRFKTNQQLIAQINQMQDSWTAVAYPEWERFTQTEVLMRNGGPLSRLYQRPKPAPATARVLQLVNDLPAEFDWRSVNGINYVSPVRDQGGCGSCYAFASAAMLEARYRIVTNNTQKLVFSPQDVVQCSEYSQGCDGGFPYLIAGKYAEDFGMVLDSCNPYSLPEPDPHVCKTNPKCRRYYATDYKYIGGYYGACNEPLMRYSLVKNGPIVVGFEVYGDFQSYQGGIYHHTGLKDSLNRIGKWDPFQLTNHAVLIVGYGSTNGQDFWIVKNSWGSSWGENGFFRIRRGSDECGIESLAMESMPIPTY